MCIVSLYTNRKDWFLLTHNRDEDFQRPSSPKAKTEVINLQSCVFPVDLQSKGTWILTSERFTTCLLNGALEPYNFDPPYTRSRGVLPMELIQYGSVQAYYKNLQTEGMQAFTQVIVEHEGLRVFVLRWDEKSKILEEINSNHLILSSSTLYDQTQQAMHNEFFSKNTLEDVNAAKMAVLHRSLFWKEKPALPMIQTTSMTQVEMTAGKVEMNYQPIDYEKTNLKNFI